jgi:hypothetical protein
MFSMVHLYEDFQGQGVMFYTANADMLTVKNNIHPSSSYYYDFPTKQEAEACYKAILERIDCDYSRVSEIVILG